MMLVSLLLLLASSFLAVESAVAVGTCPRNERGTETTEEEWDCNKGASSCSVTIDTCSSDGSWRSVSGITYYDADGSFREAVGGGWDCRDKCRGCRFSCSGSQSRTKSISRPSSGSSSGSRGSSGSRPSGGSRNCDYKCTDGGACQVTYVGPPRAGRTQGSCFPRDFGGNCSGTPRECQDCNQAITC